VEIEGLKERTIEMQQFCSAAPLCRFRCIQRIGQSMGSETSWSAVEYEEQFKEQNDFLKNALQNCCISIVRSFNPSISTF
jgi:hypothetical protein